MNYYFNISKKIPNSPLRIFILLIAVASGCISFRYLIETNRLDTIQNKSLFLIALSITFWGLLIIENKVLKKKMSLAKKELHFYLKVNALITFLALIIFAFVLFLL